MPRIREFKWDSWAEWAAQRLIEDKPEAIAVDTETTGLGFHDLAFCATMTWRTPEGSLRSAYIDLESEGWEKRRDTVAFMLSIVPTWVFWNAKFDLQKLEYLNALPLQLDPSAIEDGQPIASLINENRRLGLKTRAVEDLGYVDTILVEIQSGPNKGKMKAHAREEYLLGKVRKKLGLKKEDGYHLLPREVLIPYALKDTELTLQWWEKHRAKLTELGLDEVYAEELATAAVLRRLEAGGVGLNMDYLLPTKDEYEVATMEAWQELVELIGKPDFNPNSPAQVKEAFAVRGAHLESTDKDHLRDLAASPSTTKEAQQLITVLKNYREKERIFGTYLTPLVLEQRDAVAHPWINSVGPRTGRTSSSKATND